jgi:hypothetical protein
MASPRAGLLVLLVAISACGLDLAGKAFVATSDSPGPGDAAGANASPFDAAAFFASDDSSLANDVDVPVALVGRQPPDAADDGALMGSSQDGGLPLSPTAPGSDGDAGGPCARLLQCCPRLLAPPLALACIASAVQDAGEAACDATLASLMDAGICP